MHRLTPTVRRMSNPEKENVTVFTPRGLNGGRTPIKTLGSSPLTPARQPLAQVNDLNRSASRSQQPQRLNLKPLLPRIEALRNEGGVSQLDRGCTPLRSKSPRKSRRPKSRSSVSTPVSVAKKASTPPESVVDSITSQLFDKLLQDELGISGRQSRTQKSSTGYPESRPQPCMSSQPDREPSNGETRRITAKKISSQNVTFDQEMDPAEETEMAGSSNVLHCQVSRYVDGIIESSLQRVRVEALCNQLPSPSSAQPHAQYPRPMPSDDDISTYVDAILSVQLAIVRKTFEENQSTCTSCSPEDESVQLRSETVTLESNNDSTNMSDCGLGGESPDIGDVPMTPPQNLTLSDDLLDAFGALNMDGTPAGISPGVSPGFMQLPSRRTTSHVPATVISGFSDSTTGPYDTFCRWLDIPMRRTVFPVMQDVGVGTPTKMVDGSSSTRLVSLVDEHTGMSPVRVVDSSTETYCATSEAMVGTPVKSVPVATAITPNRLAACIVDAQTNTSPTKVTDSSTETQIETRDSGTDAHRKETSNAMVGTPVKHSTVAVAMTPIHLRDASSSVTPIKIHHMQTGTSPAKLCDAGTEMPIVNFSEVGIETSQPELVDSAVGTTPTVVMDREVGGTPLRKIDTKCGTTPYQCADSSTVMTPVFVSTAETLTSPPVVPSLRFSSSPASLDSSKLVSHVETAAISNELLRTEIRFLKKQREEAEQRLIAANKQVMEKEEIVQLKDEKIGQIHKTARVSADREIEDLMGQVGEQMMQIGQLEVVVREKNQEIHKLKTNYEQRKTDYNKQIADLQDDLCTAYKHHQQQLTDLEAKYRQEDYERHYLRSQKTVKDLETKLDAFTQLQHTLDQATQLQDEFTIIQETFGHVESVYQLTLKQRQDLQSQECDMKKEKMRIAGEKDKLNEQMEEVDRKMVENCRKMDEMLKRELDAEESRCLLERDLADAKTQIQDLQEKLDARHSDLDKTQEELLQATNQCTQLKQREVAHFLEVQSQEAAMLAQIEQQKLAEAEFDAARLDFNHTVDQLQKQCQSLSSEKIALEVDLKSRSTTLYSVEAELMAVKKTGEDQRLRITELEAQLETCRHAKRDLIQVQSQLKTLQKQFLENKSFLEEERMALEESSKEMENELRITGLELSRSKASLCEAQIVRRQLHESVANLSDQLEYLQSELDHTKAQAHWMLLNQGSEISNTSAAIGELYDQMSLALNVVQPITRVEEASKKGFVTERRGKHSVHQTQQSSSTSCPAPSGPAPSTSTSLVVSVLRAMECKETPGKTSSATNSLVCDDEPHQGAHHADYSLNREEGTDVEEDGKMFPTIGQAGASAFQTVRTASNQDKATFRGDVDGNEAGRARVESLPDQVDRLKTMFGQLYGIVTERNKKLAAEIGDLQQEMAEKDRNAKKVVQRSEGQLSLLREELEESAALCRRLQVELAEARGRSCDQKQALDYAQQRMESMAANLARFSDQKSTIEALEQQVSQLASSLKLTTREKEMALSQFDALTSVTGGGGGGAEGGTDNRNMLGHMARENLNLKRDLEKVRMKLLKRQEDYEIFHGKANRQMKVLEGNWKKAESEVFRLDQLFDHCKQILEQVPPAVCQTDPNLKLLHDMFIEE